MKIKIFFSIICLAVITFIFVKKSYAIEELEYNNSISISLRYDIDKFLQKEYKTDSTKYNIAGIDLNNDGVLEYILRRKSCDIKKNMCTHIIIAENKDKILLLSKIRAKRLAVDSRYTNGIKNLLAFKNSDNDYNFDIYMWSSKEKMYIMSEQHIRD